MKKRRFHRIRFVNSKIYLYLSHVILLMVFISFSDAVVVVVVFGTVFDLIIIIKVEVLHVQNALEVKNINFVQKL